MTERVTFRDVAFPVLACLGSAALLVSGVLAESAHLHVPPPVAFLVAAVFVAAALAMLARAGRRPQLVAWLAVLILLGFTMIGAWIALAGSAEHCRLSVGGETTGSSLGCRTAFGAGALINAGLTLWSIQLAWRSRRSSRAEAGSGDV